MATPVEKVYDVFLKQIGKDKLFEYDDYVIEDFMETALDYAIVKFEECKTDLTIDYDYDVFVENLSKEEIHILAKGMLVFWCTNKYNTEEVMTNPFTDGDFINKSPANLLNNLLKTKEMHESDFRKMRITYVNRGFNINE